MTEPNDAPHLPSLVRADRLVLRLPSRPDWIRPTVEYLRARAVLCGACHEARSGKLVVALEEALNNAIVHGNLGLPGSLKRRGGEAFARELAARAADPTRARREVEIAVDYDGQRCRWTVTDQGNGFDVAAVLRRLEADEPRTLTGGRGILMMRSLLDDVAFEEGGRRCVLTLHRTSGEERRDGPRATLHRPLRVVPVHEDGTIDWDAAYEAVSRNFSAGGVALLQACLAASPRLLIGLTTGGTPLYVPVEVRHCRALAGGVVELGCQFADAPANREASQALAQDAVGALLEGRTATPAAAGERRAHPRVAYNERIEVHTTAWAEPLVGFARDLSRGGVGFVTTRSLPLGPCVLALPQGGASPLRVRAEVVRCTRVQEGFFDVGARFLELDAPSG